jgi:hypothetical protein
VPLLTQASEHSRLLFSPAMAIGWLFVGAPTGNEEFYDQLILRMTQCECASRPDVVRACPILPHISHISAPLAGLVGLGARLFMRGAIHAKYRSRR